MVEDVRSTPAQRHGVDDVRDAFLETAAEAAQLLRGAEVERKWDDPSPLRDMSVGALAAHLGRAVLTVQRYLEADPPPADAELVDAATYYHRAVGGTGHEDEINVAIRGRAADEAASGAPALAARVDRALSVLRRRLHDEDRDATIAVLDGVAMRVDEYLDSRLVELVVHLDDLAVGLGHDDGLAIPELAARRAVAVLAEVARLNTSTEAVLRQLARRERAPAGGAYAL